MFMTSQKSPSIQTLSSSAIIDSKDDFRTKTDDDDDDDDDERLSPVRK